MGECKVISKEEEEIMATKAYEREHDRQAFRVAMLEQGFTRRQIQALENQAKEMFNNKKE